MKENNINNPFEHKDTQKSLEEIFRDEYFSHESPETYFKIASQAELVELSTPYSENLLDILETQEGTLTELGEMIAERINNEVLVDLGCGAGFMRVYAKLSGAKLYIGIDKSIRGSADRSDGAAPAFPGTSVSPLTSEEMEAILSRSVGKMIDQADKKIDKDLKGVEDKQNQERELVQNSQKTSPQESEIPMKLKIDSCNEKEILVESDMLIALSRLPDKSIAAIIASGIEFNVVRGNENTLYKDALQREIQRVLIDRGIFLGYYTDITPSLSDKYYRIGPPKKDWSFNILEKVPEKQN